MRLMFVGDTHGRADLKKVERFLGEARLTQRDALIHCGDFGAPWASEQDEALAYWRSLPMKKLICLGNHENYAFITRQPVIRRFGCRGYDLGGGLFAPLAGRTARVGGRRIWFYPGGYSIDYMLRRPGHDLFAEELLPAQEAEKIIRRFSGGRPVDFLVTHDGPRSFIRDTMGFLVGPPRLGYWTHLSQAPDSRAHPGILLDRLLFRPHLYAAWFFGHHHRDIASGSLRCLWNHALLIDTCTGETRLLPGETAETPR